MSLIVIMKGSQNLTTRAAKTARQALTDGDVSDCDPTRLAGDSVSLLPTCIAFAFACPPY